jgi:TctA family transporter
VFGFGEIIMNLSRPAEHREVFTKDVKGLWPTKQDFMDAFPAVLRGTALGSILGVLPGGGALLAAFAAYTLEKKTRGRPGEVPFGKGNIRGVAGPESANNAGAQTSFIPMLTLGIPPNAVMALMVGAMTIKGIQPGPQVMTSNPQLFWGLIASMWVGNLMLIILNLPLIGMWIKLLTVPYRFLFPAIMVFCGSGLYTLNNNNFDVFMAAAFGVVGYFFYKLGCEPAPLLLGFILGPMMEENLRRALLLSRGDWTAFITRPLSAGLLLAALLINLFALALPMFSMNVYDRVVPNHAVETLWALAIGMVLVIGADLFMRLLRSHFVDEASARVDVALSARLNGRAALSAEMALRLELAFGLDMETLLTMQMNHDIAAARRKARDIKVRKFVA